MSLTFLSDSPRWQCLSRLLAAVFGGYALASALAVLVTTVWAGPQSDGVMAGMQFSFAIYTAAIIWAFSPLRLSVIWGGLVSAIAVLVASGWWLARVGA